MTNSRTAASALALLALTVTGLAAMAQDVLRCLPETELGTATFFGSTGPSG